MSKELDRYIKCAQLAETIELAKARELKGVVNLNYDPLAATCLTQLLYDGGYGRPATRRR